MKKIYVALGLFVVLNVFGQVTFSDKSRYTTVQLVNNKIDKTVEGTPYIYQEYVLGNVQGFSDTYKMRYNAYLDEINFKKDKNDLALLKENMYGTIHLTETDETIKLENYNYKNIAIKGYLFLVAQKEDLLIYKKLSIILSPSKVATSSYDNDSPASYRKMPDVYFIKKGNSEIVEMPSNKSKLITMFPDKKAAINQYFKTNKVNFSDSNDLKKLAEIL